MNIPSIQNSQYNTNNKLKFTAHPNFNELYRKYNVTASSYFRRGIYVGVPSDEFKDIINTFKDVFTKDINNIKKMLIVGIADSEEPFSYLAVLKQIFKKVPIQDRLDLYCVDLQSMPSKEKLFKDSHYDHYTAPRYAKDSFVYDKKAMRFRVKKDIFNYLSDVYNSSNAKWETPIQEAIHKYNKEYFDLISINNTIPYVAKYIEDMQTFMQNIMDRVKAGGIIITDKYCKERFNSFKNTEEIYEGIYKKK